MTPGSVIAAMTWLEPPHFAQVDKLETKPSTEPMAAYGVADGI